MTKKAWNKPELKRIVAGAAEARSNQGLRADGGTGSTQKS